MPSHESVAAFVDALGLATNSFRTLSGSKLVERPADGQDRRNKRVVLTAKGRVREPQVTPMIEAMYTAVGTDLSDQQLRAASVLLTQIAQNLSRSTG